MGGRIAAGAEHLSHDGGTASQDLGEGGQGARQ